MNQYNDLQSNGALNNSVMIEENKKSNQYSLQSIFIQTLKTVQDKLFLDNQERGVYFIEIRDYLWNEISKNLIQIEGLTDQEREAISTKNSFHWLLDEIATKLFRKSDSKIFMSKDMTQLSLIKIDDEFKTFSQKLEDDKFKNYKILSDFTFDSDDQAQTLKFSEFINYLKSKDENQSLEQNSLKTKFFEGEGKFFDKQEKIPKFTYATYPRSGNSFFRKYFETITGVSTGNDIESKYLVNLALQIQGFKGQQVIDDRVWLVKTHYPDGFSIELDYETNKVALCVRNPLDVIASQFSFLLTWTHSKNIKGNFHTLYSETWDKYLRYQINRWSAFHRWWLEYAEKTGTPLYIFRYEEIIQKNPLSTLKEFFQFSLESDSIDGSVMEQRLKEIIKTKGHQASVIYQPRSSTGQITAAITQVNKNRQRYTREQLEYIKEVASDLLYFFGYVDIDNIEEEEGYNFDYNPTGFFEFESHNSDNLSKHFGFKNWNQSALKTVANQQIKEPSSFKSDTGHKRFIELIGKDVTDPVILNENLQIKIEN